jgi:hypothetical protein
VLYETLTNHPVNIDYAQSWVDLQHATCYSDELLAYLWLHKLRCYRRRYLFITTAAVVRRCTKYNHLHGLYEKYAPRFDIPGNVYSPRRTNKRQGPFWIRGPLGNCDPPTTCSYAKSKVAHRMFVQFHSRFALKSSELLSYHYDYLYPFICTLQRAIQLRLAKLCKLNGSAMSVKFLETSTLIGRASDVNQRLGHSRIRFVWCPH